MWQRRLLIALVTLAALGAGVWFLVQRYGPDLAIELTGQDLQARVAARFPIQNCALILVCLDITAPQLKLAEGSDRISLSADLSATLGQRHYTGALAFSGKVRYVAPEGAFYFDDIEIHRLDLTGVPAHYTDLLRARGPAVLRTVLASRPLYTLREDNARERFARMAVQDVRVVNGKLRIAFVKPVTEPGATSPRR